MSEETEVSSASIGETPEIKMLCEEFRSLNPKLMAIQTRVDFIKKKLADLTEGKTVLSAGVSIKTSTRKGSIDYSMIRGIQKMTEDGSIEKYRKPSVTMTTIKVVG